MTLKPNHAKDDSNPPEKEQVNHPLHYGGEDNPYEAIKVIEAWNLGFHLGNVVKYICRAFMKENPIQNLEKAKWYLDRKIEKLKEKRIEAGLDEKDKKAKQNN